MNAVHLQLCASPEWAAYVERELLPWALGDGSLGPDVLEVGPGPGLTTDVLRRRVPHLTAVELDADLARQLAARLTGGGVDVVRGDATSLPFAAGRFSTATTFTMLHHVPSPVLQDRVLGELARVLRPGGTLLGADGTDTSERRALHDDDIFVPVDPDGLGARLDAAGFERIEVEVRGDRFRFLATTPA